jgi:hypothetical protein
MAMQEVERYCAAHPNSPVAIRHPKLSIRGRTFIALLGQVSRRVSPALATLFQ